jgi:hypothetical protein
MGKYEIINSIKKLLIDLILIKIYIKYSLNIKKKIVKELCKSVFIDLWFPCTLWHLVHKKKKKKTHD